MLYERYAAAWGRSASHFHKVVDSYLNQQSRANVKDDSIIESKRNTKSGVLIQTSEYMNGVKMLKSSSHTCTVSTAASWRSI